MDAVKKFFNSTQPGGKENPYKNPYHPNHNPKPAPPAPTTTTPFTQPPPRPASPRESLDYLAEAREAVGRDRITGRRRDVIPDITLSDSDSNRSQVLSRGGVPGTGTEGERSAFANTNAGAKKRSGTKYDLFVQQMKERKVGGYREHTEGYYAPAPKQATEYYAPPSLQTQFYAPANAAPGRKR